MKMEAGQISVFELLGERRTPLLRPEEARAGMTAWKLEAELWQQGIDDERLEIVYLRAIRVRIREAELCRDGSLHIWWESDDVEIHCGGSSFQPLYVRRPDFDELRADFLEKHRGDGRLEGVPIVPWIPREDRRET